MRPTAAWRILVILSERRRCPKSDLTESEPRRVTALAQAVVDSSVERQRAENPEDVVLPDDLLPGTRELRTPLLLGLRKVGVTTFADPVRDRGPRQSAESSGLAVLAPNIQQSFHVSSGVIVFVSGISGGFLVLGIVPLGWLADRVRRGPVVAFATFFFGLMVFASGVATNIFLFFLARFGAGISQASTQTVHGSLLADTYPIGLRGRISASMSIGMGIAGAISPVLVGTRRDGDRRNRRMALVLLHPGGTHPRRRRPRLQGA